MVSDVSGRKERRLTNAAHWLARNWDKFPEGVSASDIEGVRDWEEARYKGVVHLKEPESVMVVQLPEDDRHALRAFGVGDFDKVQRYVRRIGPETVPPASADLLPWSLRGSRESTSRLMGALFKRGALLRRKVGGRWVYSQAARLVFGVHQA